MRFTFGMNIHLFLKVVFAISPHFVKECVVSGAIVFRLIFGVILLVGRT